MKLLRRPRSKALPHCVRTRFVVEIELDPNQLPSIDPIQSIHSRIEMQTVRLLTASGYRVMSFNFAPFLSRRDKDNEVRTSMEVDPVVIEG